MKQVNAIDTILLTSDEHQARRELIVNKIKELNPDAEFNTGKYSIELIHYSVTVICSKVTVTKETKTIYSYPQSSIDDIANKMTKNVYLTKNAALDAINAVMPKAKSHFENCLKEFRDLKTRLSFSVGFNYDGDTHGIYNEYEYISFKLDGFDFQFILEF